MRAESNEITLMNEEERREAGKVSLSAKLGVNEINYFGSFFSAPL